MTAKQQVRRTLDIGTEGDGDDAKRTIGLVVGILCAGFLIGAEASQAPQTEGMVSANSDPNYRALRDATPGESYAISGLKLQRDVATFVFKSGSFRFLQPVLGRTVMAVFEGDGQFSLTPVLATEQDYLLRLTEKDRVEETFDRLVLCFTDDTFEEIQRQAQPVDAQPRAGENVLQDLRKRLRRNTDEPRSFLTGLLSGEDVENIEAELLAGLYNPNQAGLFSAYIFGREHSDLRFHMRPRGLLPQLSSPEEVGLLNVDTAGSQEGIWYLAHLMSEYENGQASSQEYEWPIDAEHYRIETLIRDEKISATAELTFKATEDGPRVLRFGLLPSLRVNSVTAGEGKPVAFIQESKQEDSAFYVVLPEPMIQGQQYGLKIDYQGEEVLEDQGGGNFAVGARSSWYPSVNSFSDRATYDLTFKVEDKYVLVSVGKLMHQERKDKMEISHWVSDIPLAVAGFNYGRFKKKEVVDEETQYKIEGYAVSTVPDYLRSAPCLPTQYRPGACGVTGGDASPTRLTEILMVEAQNAIRVFSHWFGEAPYGRIAITQQPQFSFGQSWPTLVYLPIVAFLDTTERWNLIGLDKGFTDFIQEVTPHEVAHQWWGHMVGWSSYHDQWLSEGFSDFSASVYLQTVEKNNPGRFLNFWETSRKTIIEKNQFGIRPNDAGPVWLGLRLSTAKTPGAYSQLVYAKGGFILHMLRQMMYDPKTGDERFIAMMRDFVETHLHKNASTESFKNVVEKHIQPAWDLDDNGHMDWFFSQWVYGTELPNYRIDYKLTPQNDGKVLLAASVTQSGVSENFKMPVPIYLEFENGIVRLGQAKLIGNTTLPEVKVMLPRMPKRVMVNAMNDVLAVENVGQQIK